MRGLLSSLPLRESVSGCERGMVEARGGEHANARRGKERLHFDAWPRPGEGEYIRDKYATCEVAI